MKIKQLKIINQDQSTEVADIGADAVNIDYNDTNVKLKLDELSNNVDTNTTNISNEIAIRANAVTNLQSQINGLASGSPKGSYANAAAIVTANPDTGVYIAQDNGHIYSWVKNGSNAIDLGIYQAVEVDIESESFKDFVRGKDFISDVPGNGGTELDNSNNDLNNESGNRIRVYYTTNNAVFNVPNDLAIISSSNTICFEFCAFCYKTAVNAVQTQVLVDLVSIPKNIYIRTHQQLTSPEWSDWQKICLNSNTIIKDRFLTGSAINNETKNLNNCSVNTIRSYYARSSSLENIPSDYVSTSLDYTQIITYGVADSYQSQIFHSFNQNATWTRDNSNGTWSNWLLLNNDLSNFFQGSDFIQEKDLTDINKDMNNIIFNRSYLYFVSPSLLLNIPEIKGRYANKLLFNLHTFAYDESGVYGTQLLHDLANNTLFYRSRLNNDWTEWKEVNENIEDKNSEYNYLTTIIQEPLDISNKAFTFCGDSITAGNFIGATNVWAKWLSDKFNTSYTNKAVGGATFASVEGLTQIINEINNTTLNSVLFIAGGINDYARSVSKTDFTNAVTNLCSWLKTNYEGIVIFITPLNHVWTTITNDIPLNWYREEITRIALLNGYSVIAGNEIGFPNKTGDMATFLYHDGLHPSIDGQKMYANKVYQFLK